jgi:hypothetical protein
MADIALIPFKAFTRSTWPSDVPPLVRLYSANKHLRIRRCNRERRRGAMIHPFQQAHTGRAVKASGAHGHPALTRYGQPNRD